MVFTACERDCSGFHRETLLLGMDYDTVPTTAVIHELTDNIFTVGVKRLRFGPCLLVAAHLAVSA